MTQVVEQTFIDHLKNNDLHEAIQVIKTELSERARKVTQEIRVAVAEGFEMKKKDDDADDEDDDDGEDDDKKKKEQDDEDDTTKE